MEPATKGPGTCPRYVHEVLPVGPTAPHPTGNPQPVRRDLTNGHVVRLLLAGEGQQHFVGGRLRRVQT